MFRIITRAELERMRADCAEGWRRAFERGRALDALEADYRTVKAELRRALERSAAFEEDLAALYAENAGLAGDLEAARAGRDEYVKEASAWSGRVLASVDELEASRHDLARGLEDARGEIHALRLELLEALRDRDTARAALAAAAPPPHAYEFSRLFDD